MPKNATAKHDSRRDTPTVEFLPSLKPRPRLALGLGIVLGVWILTLVTLYFTTVWPHRHANQPAAPGEPRAVNPQGW